MDNKNNLKTLNEAEKKLNMIPRDNINKKIYSKLLILKGMITESCCSEENYQNLSI